MKVEKEYIEENSEKLKYNKNYYFNDNNESISSLYWSLVLKIRYSYLNLEIQILLLKCQIVGTKNSKNSYVHSIKINKNDIKTFEDELLKDGNRKVKYFTKIEYNYSY